MFETLLLKTKQKSLVFCFFLNGVLISPSNLLIKLGHVGRLSIDERHTKFQVFIDLVVIDGLVVPESVDWFFCSRLGKSVSESAVDEAGT